MRTTTAPQWDLEPPRTVEDERFAHLLPATLRAARGYVSSQWEADAVRRTQIRRLARCLAEAVVRVPAYRRLGIDVSRAHQEPWACLAEFPTLDKHEIQASMESFVADDFDPERAFRLQTSGSTGIPLTVMQDELGLTHEGASFHRLFDSLDFAPGDRICRVYSDSTKQQWATTAQLLPVQVELAALNVLSPEAGWETESLALLEAWEPDGLSGNPSDLLALALTADRRDVRLNSVRFAISAGENLPAGTRAVLESVFDCRVTDVYSMQELRNIAWECEVGTMHVNEDRAVLENCPGGGETPELLLTTLTNRTMPLIRYRTGDLGRHLSWENAPCACGRRLGRIEDFCGRDRGFIVLPDGRLLGPKPVKQVMTEQPVATWQIEQPSPRRLQVRLVAPPAGRPAGVVDHVTRAIGDLVGGQLSIEVEWVDAAALRSDGRKLQMFHPLPNQIPAANQSTEKETPHA